MAKVTAGIEVVGEETKYCNYTYPTTIEALKLTSTYDSKTGIAQYAADVGNIAVKTYCDGSATALAVATTAVVALTVSLN